MFQPDKLSDLLKPDVKADLFSLEALIAWLRVKPAAKVYCYLENGECLIAQYLKERCGYTRPNVRGHDFNELGDPGNARALPFGWGKVAIGEPHTFGGALSRAIAIQSGAK